MGLEEDIEKIGFKISTTIGVTLTSPGNIELYKATMKGVIDENVYDEYEPTKYIRRGGTKGAGGLADTEAMESDMEWISYDTSGGETFNFTMWSEAMGNPDYDGKGHPGDAAGERIDDIVAAGKPFPWKSKRDIDGEIIKMGELPPRPFADDAAHAIVPFMWANLRYALQNAGFDVKAWRTY